MADRNRGKTKTADAIPVWSWLAAAVGMVLVLASTGFLLYEALAGDSSPPEFVIEETDPVVPSGTGHLVRFRVVNRGGSPAAGLMVEGTLEEGATTVETSSLTIDYVPSHSARQGGLFFSEDPRKFDLKIRALGYMQP